MPGRRRSPDDFTVEILDNAFTKYTSLYHRRFKKTYIVAKTGEEYQVRVTVKPPAWDLHDHNWFFAKLMVDDRYVRGRFLKKPDNYYQGGEPNEDISWTFNTMNGGWAFKFGHRSDGRANNLTERDEQVGQIQVSFMAACKRESRDTRPRHRRRRDDDYYDEPVCFDGDAINQSQKDKISLMRTVRGRRLHQPQEGGGGGGPPATIVSDFVYATVVVHYDSADHLRYRGILRPQSIKEHRQWFPEEDFRRNRRQQVKATIPLKRSVCDLTGDTMVVRKEHTHKRKTAEERSRRVHEQRERERQREVNIGLPVSEGESSYADYTQSSNQERSWKRRRRNVSRNIRESDDEKDWEPVYDDGT